MALVFVGAQMGEGIGFASDLCIVTWICRSPCTQQRENTVGLGCNCSAKCRFVVILVVFGTFGTTEPWQCNLQAHSSLLSPSLYVLLFFLSLSVATETVGFVWPLQLLRVINGLRMLIPLCICRLRNSVVLGFLWREYPVTARRRLLGSSWVHRSLNS